MKRVPVELVILMLAQDGITVNARQLRNWKLRGRISRGEGYDLLEIAEYLARRNAPKAPKPPATPRQHRPRRLSPTVGYDGIHHRLRAQKGHADLYQCCECGRRASEWAYDHGDPEEIVDARGRVFSRKLEHYQTMCRRCHQILDGRHAVDHVA